MKLSEKNSPLRSALPEIGQRLALARQERELEIAQVAKVLRVNPAKLSSIEAGRSTGFADEHSLRIQVVSYLRYLGLESLVASLPQVEHQFASPSYLHNVVKIHTPPFFIPASLSTGQRAQAPKLRTLLIVAGIVGVVLAGFVLRDVVQQKRRVRPPAPIAIAEASLLKTETQTRMNDIATFFAVGEIDAETSVSTTSSAGEAQSPTSR